MIATSRSMLVTALAFALTSAAAVAQDKSSEVTIVATQQVELAAGRTNGGQRVEVAQLSRVVSYADLNIATHSGATELEKRINNAARAVCKKLEVLYPSGTSHGLGSGSCVADATKDAMAKARVAIAAAESAAAQR